MQNLTTSNRLMLIQDVNEGFQNYNISTTVINSLNIYSYNLIQLTNNLKCVCKIIPNSSLNRNYCTLDKSVIKFKSLPSLYELLTDSLHIGGINLNEIKPLNINLSKEVKISVIFNNTSQVIKWSNKKEELTKLCRNILMLFVITNNCIISVKSLKKLTKSNMDIAYIIVHNTSSTKNACRINEATCVKFEKILSARKLIQSTMVNNNQCKIQIAALNSQALFLKNIVKATNTKTTKKILLIGPAGCGKTLLVQHVARETNATLITIQAHELSNPSPGKSESRLRELFNEAKRAALEDAEDVCCIILVDQVENICRKSESTDRSHLKRLSSEFINLLEGLKDTENIVVVGVTSNVHLVDDSVRRFGYFETELYVGIPNEKERCEILQLFFEKLSWEFRIEDRVAAFTPGFTGSDLDLLVRSVYKESLKNLEILKNNSTIEEEFLKNARKQRPSGLSSGLGVISGLSKLKMSSIGGLSNVKKTLKSFIQWPISSPEVFLRMGLALPKGVLLYGPPGCAKTSLVCAVANETNANFLSVSSAELYSSYVGETARNVIELFNKARLNIPCIIFIDEIDALVGNRLNGQSAITDQVLSAFLTEMDGVGIKMDSINKTNKKGELKSGIMVIGATNRPDKLDSSILRPGRFDKLIYIPPPDYEDRLKILRTIIECSKIPLADDVDLTEIANRTNYYSGADIQSLITEAGLEVMLREGLEAKEIKQPNLLSALKIIKPSLKRETISFYENLNF